MNATLADPRPPYWRLSTFYLFYFGALGALAPFWGPYLQSRGLEAAAIGGLMAILLGTKMIAPLLWGLLADHTGRSLRWVRLAAGLTMVIFAAIFWAQSLWSIALVMFAFSFFWNASLPQMEAATLNHLGSEVRRYASIRLWGSVGFILMVLGLGYFVDELGMDIIPQAVLVLFVAVWGSTLLVPECRLTPASNTQPALGAVLAKPDVRWFLVTCFLMQLSHGVYYAFYSIHLEEAGYHNTVVGALWAFGVIVEVVVFLRMHWLLERFGAHAVLLVSLALAIVRWTLTGTALAWWPMQLAAQTLHAATFGAFHAAAIHLVHHYFRGRTQGRGQALYNAVSFGAGGAAGSLIAGLLWQRIGAMWIFVLAAAVAALGWIICYRLIDPDRCGARHG